MAKKAKKLIPVDRKQCQAEKPCGNNFMTLGGCVGQMERCTSKPTVIITELKAGSDGRKGRMAVCEGCLAQYKKQNDNWRELVKVTPL
jgi:hypothetical protein